MFGDLRDSQLVWWKSFLNIHDMHLSSLWLTSHSFYAYYFKDNERPSKAVLLLYFKVA